MGHDRNTTLAQRRILDSDLGHDSGERYALVAVSGYGIDDDAFGTVFSIIDTDTGDEVATSSVTAARYAREERVRMLAQMMHLNGREDVFAA